MRSWSRCSLRARVAMLGCGCAFVGTALVAGTEMANASFTTSTNASQNAISKSRFNRATVQSGTATSTANATTTVTITSINTATSFLLFSTNDNLNRPVAEEIGGQIASATTVQFIRVTDEASPVTVTIRWSVISYHCGINVQRGTVAESATTIDVAITAVNSIAAAFVTYSKTPSSSDTSYNNNDPLIAELTTASNLEIRIDAAASTHTIYWQVIEFTDPTMINVQKGTTSLTGATTSTTATLATAVNTAHAFMVVSTHSSGTGTDIGSGLVRGQLTNATTVSLDRSAANYDVTEISWQVVELKDGSTVQAGTTTLGSGTATATVTLSAVTLARTSAFASTETGGGQTAGRTPDTTSGIVGVASVTAAVTSTTQLTLTRANTGAATDIAWFVVSWGRP